MSIKIACPKCDRMHSLGDHLAGKKVRCKGCDYSFLVKSRDEPDEDLDEQERRPKRSKRKSKDAGIPVWVWVTAGGGGALVVAVIAIVVVILVANRRRDLGADNPRQAKVPADPGNLFPRDNNPIAPPAAPGPHAAIMEEFGTSWNAATDAIAAARDAGSTTNAANQLRAEATKMDNLAQRWRAAGRPPAADVPQLKQIDQRLTPSLNRLETEARSLKQRLPSMKVPFNTLNDLDQAMNAFSNAGKNFIAAAK